MISLELISMSCRFLTRHFLLLKDCMEASQTKLNSAKECYYLDACQHSSHGILRESFDEFAFIACIYFSKAGSETPHHVSHKYIFRCVINNITGHKCRFVVRP